MTVNYTTQNQVPSAVQQNLTNKGYGNGHPTPGCTYVVQPNRDYHDLFQDLQRTLKEAELPIAPVRIPHSTVMLAKVIDQKPGQSWKDLEQVQKIFQAFLLFHLTKKEIGSVAEYQSSVHKVLLEVEESLNAISQTTNREDALATINDPVVRESIGKILEHLSYFNKVIEFALESLNQTSFDLRLKSVSLTINGSVIFQLTEAIEMLQMRLDLIVAGQGISKWPKLSAMKHGWSTVGYTVRLLTDDEKAKTDDVIGKWVEDNQAALSRLFVTFNVDTLGCLAVRSNDFYSVKRVEFPMAKTLRERLSPIDVQYRISEDDLRMTPRSGDEGPTPILGNRTAPEYGREIWQGNINQEVVGNRSYERSNWKIPALNLSFGIAAIAAMKFLRKS